MATQPTPQPPAVPPAGDPNAQYGPAPAEQATPYQQCTAKAHERPWLQQGL